MLQQNKQSLEFIKVLVNKNEWGSKIQYYMEDSNEFGIRLERESQGYQKLFYKAKKMMEIEKLVKKGVKNKNGDVFTAGKNNMWFFRPKKHHLCLRTGSFNNR